MGNRHNTITLPEGISAIQAYNKGIYGKTQRKNIDIDDEARKRFSTGLGNTQADIEEQVRFMGRDYGGTANTLASQRLPKVISEDIFSVRAEYMARFSSEPSLISGIPQRKDVEFLYQPFQQVLKSPNGKRTWKNWLTWGTKFWHFCNPDAFPILDSRARKFFEISSSSGVIDSYFELLARVRSVLLTHQSWLPRLRQVDGGHAWSDIKLWDKIAYELGAK